VLGGMSTKAPRAMGSGSPVPVSTQSDPLLTVRKAPLRSDSVAVAGLTVREKEPEADVNPVTVVICPVEAPGDSVICLPGHTSGLAMGWKDAGCRGG
jgi:hypothetical protein